MTVVAINIQPYGYTLKEWIGFWKEWTGAGDVLWAQDTKGSAVREYRLVALGTEVIVARQGQVAFRSDGPAGYSRLRSEVDKALSR